MFVAVAVHYMYPQDNWRDVPKFTCVGHRHNGDKMQLNRRVAANDPVLPVMQMDEKERRRRAMMGGAKGAMSATVSTMQTTGSKSSMNGENDTMQMMRQAIRQKMIASASMKKLVVEVRDLFDRVYIRRNPAFEHA